MVSQSSPLVSCASGGGRVREIENPALASWYDAYIYAAQHLPITRGRFACALYRFRDVQSHGDKDFPG
jgi:hypothetical protein